MSAAGSRLAQRAVGGSPTAFGKNATERGFRDGLPISHPAAASTQSLTC
jgi:hypothetical protein